MTRRFRLLSVVCLPIALTACGESDGLTPDGAEGLGTIEQELGCSGQLVPTSTQATSQVFGSGSYSAEYPEWRAFDSSTSSMWISSLKTTPAILGYDSGAALRVTRYAITYSNGSITTRAPKNWVFEGWNGSSWLVLDTRTNQTNWAGFERREFTVATPGSYTKHRIRISDDNDSRASVEVISMGNFELGGCDAVGNPLWFRNLGAAAPGRKASTWWATPRAAPIWSAPPPAASMVSLGRGRWTATCALRTGTAIRSSRTSSGCPVR